MKRLGRWLAAFGALVAVCAAAGFLWLRTSLPQIDGTLRIAGLTHEIEILRDKHGVPHIFAASEEDAYFALGFVHAQDRLWQMETMRLVGAGRLSELVGERGMRSDRFVRTLGLYRLAQQSVAKLPTAMRDDLEAYTRGVNAAIDAMPAALPPEFIALRHRPERWRPADSLVWGRLMALRLAGNWQSEAERARLAARLSPQQIDDLWPDTASRRQATLPPQEIDRLATALLDAVPPELGPVTASNVWALSGARSASGKPLLANDPHLGFQVPEIWYLARIEAPGISLTGATTPGVPFVILGHNDRIAWGISTTHSDTQDLFIERLDPQDDTKYLTPDGPRGFTTRDETILTRDGPATTLSVRETRHGPVVAGLDPALDAAAPARHVLAFASPGLRPDDRTAEAIWRINRARDQKDFEAALQLFEAPQQNVVYADVDGNIGMVSAGLVPIRKSGDGTRPAEGWTGAKDWIGFLPYDALPRSFNPVSGYVANANNKPFADSYPHFLGRYWLPPHRAERLVALLEATGKHTPETTAQIQMDEVSGEARDLLPLMLKIEPSSDRARRALALLANWDGGMDGATIEPLLYTAWYRSLVHVVASDELGPMFSSMWDLRPDFLLRVLTRETSWCDNIDTPNVESCADALATSLDQTLAGLAETEGDDMTKWRWDRVHKAHFRHMPFTFVPVLRDLVDIVVPEGGGSDTIQRAAMAMMSPTPYRAVHGPGLRAVYDLADLDASRFIVATGQSGNPFSLHYNDLNALWAAGRSITIAGKAGDLRLSAEGTLTLAPVTPAR